MPTWLKRVLAALGFAAFIALQLWALGHQNRPLPYVVGTYVYLFVIALVGVGVVAFLE
jgi:hypothetical protein